MPAKIAWNLACVRENCSDEPQRMPLTCSLGFNVLSGSHLFHPCHRSLEDIQIITVAGMGTGRPGCPHVRLLDRRSGDIEIELQRLLQGML